MNSIFISYRRNDNPDAAGRVYDRLKSHFHEANVFFDIDSIPPGVDFRQFITEIVSKCDVLVVIIGERWLESDSSGKSRLGDTTDFVRIEVETALKRGIPVIPVPVGKANLPSEKELPVALQDLLFRNAVEVKSGTSFEGHMQRLIQGIEIAIKKKEIKKRPKWKLSLTIAVSFIAVFILGYFGIYVPKAAYKSDGNYDKTKEGAIVDSLFDDSTDESESALKELYLNVSQGAPAVTMGEKATIYIQLKGADGRVVPDATVLLEAGGGKFLGSENTDFDASSRLHGPYSVTGKTDAAGVFTAWWVCNPCATGYGMSVSASKDGYMDGKGELTVTIRSPAS